ncbi:beta-1,4-N-acetylgalactosaminyltransferase bre-4-like isoform X2 [Brevipalpus obovatus]|uniref:beta-1,4-N-acetylgalactosaminyltransferase bre-4-like isoform X2 n=1 Tax=Brevipalpus obovatus TaxID=246614 RepID=UPI003D9EA3A8
MVIRGHLVPIPVPPVRAISRRSLKHFLRLLPSVLGLLFILSLIFITLMNVAIINANRQFNVVQRSTSPILSTNQIVHQQQQQYHQDNVQSMGMDGGSLRRMNQLQSLVAPIVSHFSPPSPSSPSDLPSPPPPLPSMIRVNVSNDSLTNADKKHDTLDPRNECPLIPSSLVGRLPVDTDLSSDDESLEEYQLKANGLMPGGAWEPNQCRARHKVAIIIPYRDRKDHLHALLHHLHPILQRQQISYRIYVVEQFGNDTFNKGVLMNAGVREALKESDFNCFIFHDVDLIPEDDRNLYSCPSIPRHMSVAVDKFNYTLPYPYLVGGVFAISKAHFTLVNGYSNLYWGWGGEDDDMAHRLKLHDLKILRPPESIGRYTMIKHKHRAESPNNVRTALLRMAKRRASRDGFNSVRYKIISRVNELLLSHVFVEIDPIHKWSFPSPNKLVIHF